MLSVVGCAARGGARAGLIATCGVAVSEVIHVAAAAAGVYAIFLAVPTAFTVLRVVGAVYLAYWSTRTPKMVTFTVALMPQFASTSVGPPAPPVRGARSGSGGPRLRCRCDGWGAEAASARGCENVDARAGLDFSVAGVFLGLAARLPLDRSPDEPPRPLARRARR